MISIVIKAKLEINSKYQYDPINIERLKLAIELISMRHLLDLGLIITKRQV